jgi:hypothetical protein
MKASLYRRHVLSCHCGQVKIREAAVPTLASIPVDAHPFLPMEHPLQQ